MPRLLRLAIVWGALLCGCGSTDEPPRASEPAPAAVPVAAAPAVAPPIAAAASRVLVTAAEGTVERQRGDAGWQPARAGDVLAPSDTLRTGDGASARLEIQTLERSELRTRGPLGGEIGNAATVEVAERTRFEMGQISSQVNLLTLQDGRLGATLRAGAPRLRVAVSGGDAIAESSGGRFTVLGDGRGQLSVTVEEGTTSLASTGETVQIAAGELSLARSGQRPSQPQRIAPSLYLKVGKPRSRLQRERELLIQGTTVAGALIDINGVRTLAAEDGSFAVAAPLDEGTNDLQVVARDALGRTERARISVEVDSSAPPSRTRVEWK